MIDELRLRGEKIHDLNAVIACHNENNIIMKINEDIRDGQMHDLKLRNFHDNLVNDEVKGTWKNQYTLLQNNYLDLRKDYDTLMRKYNDLEMELAGTVNSKALNKRQNEDVNFVWNF